MLTQRLNFELIEKCTMENQGQDELRIVQTTSITDSFKKKIEENYMLLKDRYGESLSKVIMAAALVGCLSPIPGTSVLVALPFVGLGELMNWLMQNPETHKEICSAYEMETKTIKSSILK